MGANGHCREKRQFVLSFYCKNGTNKIFPGEISKLI
jgi:hypothetical protein